MWFWWQKRPAPLPHPSKPAVIKSHSAALKNILAESRRVLDTDLSEFAVVQRAEDTRRDFCVYVKPVEGTKLTMVRLEAEVPLAPDTLFHLLSSMDGKQVVDPFPKDKHAVPVEELRMPGGEARVVYSEMPRFHGVLRPREYVTCDASVTKEKLFVCKSCEVDSGPLASVARGKVRATLLYAHKVKPSARGGKGSHLQVINFLDLGPPGRDVVPPWLANAVTERWYTQGVVRRLRRYIDAHGLTPDSPPAAVPSPPHRACS